MGAKLNLVGEKYGRLTVIEVCGERDNHGRLKWICLCDCGNKVTVQSGNLRTGTSKSCGCLLNKPAINSQNLIGNRYGKLITTKRIRSNNKTYYDCICDCGNVTNVWHAALVNGKTKSCGCLTKRIGEDHPLYDSSMSKERRFRSRGTDKMRKWRVIIKQINGNKCVKCNSGDKLISHHLYSYTLNPDRSEDLDNGVCLCDKCHKEYHKNYGKFSKQSTFHQFMSLPEWDDNMPRLIDLLKSASEDELRFIDSISKPFDSIDQELYALKNGIMYINERINKAIK